MHIYLYILCAYAQFYDKRIYFVDCAKKIKKNVIKKLILVPNFCHFYIMWLTIDDELRVAWTLYYENIIFH
jgi:hypothetical protein